MPSRRAALARRVALALALGALAAPAAAAAQSDQTGAALQDRSAALNRLVHEQPELFTAMGQKLAEAEERQDALSAYGRRWEALGQRFATPTGASAQPDATARPVSDPAGGFDWLDAGVGLAFGFGLFAVAGAAALAARRHRVSPR